MNSSAGKHISRPDAAVMDAPLWCHYRKLALWLVLEGILIALSIVARTDHVSRCLCEALSWCPGMHCARGWAVAWWDCGQRTPCVGLQELIGPGC